MVWALRKISYYRLGGKHVQILTDHRALEAAMSRDLTPDLSNRVFRLLEEALSCNISIKWVKSAGNMLADSLSRTPTGEADAPHYERFTEDHIGQAEVNSVVARIRQGQIVDPLLIRDRKSTRLNSSHSSVSRMPSSA